MTYGQVISQLESQLEALGEEKESLSYVFKELKNWTLTDLILQLPKSVSAEDKLLLEEIFDQLAQHIPAQHITGKAYFKDLTLKVTSDILIPRPETEELVDLILSENPQEDLRILDIGTGSGAIALALKSARPGWQVVAADISPEALAVARENARANQVEVAFLQSDVYSAIAGQFDIIVSNPPYIAFEDKDEVGTNVYLHEPHTALFAEENGLAIYRQILSGAQPFLTEKGKIYFEIGYKQGQDLQVLAEQYLPEKSCRILKDMFGKERMVVMDEK
ncbi:peptide chain release factor N(5)-glutamine methyltransferase [Streptococcus gallolyticus]|nr:peptide chain release factor N(5)-glutamine methyltransferase [Streptococcus gallolyticus]MBY5041303.1 peptide chain release factor N(5)-glutamine methyltransferase [Streptococcus gallolyticus]